MPNYRIEALVYHKEPKQEDKLEHSVLTHLYELQCTGVQVVSFVVSPAGS